MRILMISKAFVVGQYQTKAEELARKPGVELTVVVPPSWRDERGVMQLEKEHVDGYELVVAQLRLNGHYHLHFYPGIGEILEHVKPDLVHIDEEPYNLATFHTMANARRQLPRPRAVFFTWQNLPHNYPLPFSWMEAYVYANADYALAGNGPAEQVLRSKGFTKPIRVIPQFGVDPDIFRPAPPREHDSEFVVGFAARLVPEKGASLLLSALRQLGKDWELRIVGSGPERKKLEASARRLGIASSVRFFPWQTSEQMPDFFRALDVLVAPSLSRPNWTEQFGRVLIEAMACGVPVVGSSSGEIPNVVGDAGLIFPEGDVEGLAGALSALMSDRPRREDIARRGRARVLEKYTQSRIADETYAVYRELMQQFDK
jgi:glycosyltransferase involved in cell wall biosynthesis